jgi:hypothetical protein
MRILSFIIFIFLIFLSRDTVYSQVKDFNYKREIGPIPHEGWFSIILPDDIFGHLNTRFSDLRLYRLAEDTLEIPYLLKIQENELTETVTPLTVLNKSQKAGILYFTLELGSKQNVNHITLSFKEENYNAFVTLEGSDNQKDWFELSVGNRILSIHDDGVEYAVSTVNFPLSNYNFFRVTVKSDTLLTLARASLKNQTIKKGIINELAQTWKVQHDHKVKQTYITIKLRNAIPVNQLNLQAENDGDYYRNLSIAYVYDSSQSPKGWVKFYNTISTGYSTSFSPNAFVFPYVVAREFRITINNLDNIPLKIKNIELLGPQVELLARLQPAKISLYYGNSALRHPSYDLIHFQKNIPDSVGVLSLDVEEDIRQPAHHDEPLFGNQFWLWGIMGIMIAVLGFFTLRMIKTR